MKIEVSEYEKKYIFELEPVTQLCGQNIPRKTYIVDSLCKYFSSYKYAEVRNKWRDNIRVDDELIGRKYFSLLSIHKTSDLLSTIRLSKQSLMMEYLKSLMQQFEWQTHLEVIRDELEVMFQELNEKAEWIGEIAFDYSSSELWDIIQKSEVTGKKGEDLDEKNPFELLGIMLNLLEEVLAVDPKKMLVVIENIDHFLSVGEYREMIERMQYISAKYDIYFLVTTSLEGYVVCTEELCTGITVLNELVVQLPEMEELLKAINDNYPCNKNLKKEQLSNVMGEIIQRIGKQSYLTSVEDEVICKIFNKSLMLNDRWDKNEKSLEIGFLKA